MKTLIFWGFTEKSVFRGGSRKSNKGENCLKKGGGGLGQIADFRRGGGAWQERGGWCF